VKVNNGKMIFDEFGGFLSQLPPGLLIYPCLLFFAFLLAVLYFAVIRPRRRRKTREPDATPISTTNPPPVDALFSSTPEGSTKPKGVTDKLRAGEVLPSFKVILDSGETVHAKTVVTILRDPADDRLLIHLEGVAYRSINDFPASKRKFTALMKELAQNIAESAPPRTLSRSRKTKSTPPAPEQPAAAGTDDGEPSPPVASTPPASTAPAGEYDLPPLDDLVHGPKPAVNTPLPPPLEPAVKAALAPDKPDDDAPGALPDYKAIGATDKMVKTGGILRRNKLELAPLPELNIAAAIEAYLQHRLGATRRFLGRRIHVHSAPNGGVRIEVDGTFYEAVSDITDEDVREFVSATIQEWQDRQ
jgi:hypothetical protein